MIELVDSGWQVQSVEEMNGYVSEAVLVRDGKEIRLVNPDKLLAQMADMDPFGKLLGSVFAEAFTGSKLSKEALHFRQASNFAKYASEEVLKRAENDPALLIKKRRKRASDFGRTK